MNKYVYLGYVLRNTSPISKRTLIKHTCSSRVNLLCYEHWTDKQKYFYVYLIPYVFIDGKCNWCLNSELILCCLMDFI